MKSNNKWTKLPKETRTKILTEQGYKAIDGRAEHRLIYTEHYGKIPKYWVVHHIDGKKGNNVPTNLIAIPEKYHNLIHAQYEVTRCLPSREDIQIALKLIIKGVVQKELVSQGLGDVLKAHDIKLF